MDYRYDGSVVIDVSVDGQKPNSGTADTCKHRYIVVTYCDNLCVFKVKQQEFTCLLCELAKIV